MVAIEIHCEVPKSPVKKESWLEMFHEFASETTLHGVHEISKYWAILPLRIFFILAQIGCCSIMCYHMYLVISNFMAEPTLIQTVTTSNSTYRYPSVTFCPQLWLNVTKYSEIGIPKPAFLYAMALMKRVVVNEPFNVTLGKQQLEQFMDEKNISTFYELYMSLANDYTNDSFFCRECSSWPPKKVITEEGVCYRFTFDDWTPNYLVENTPKITYTPVVYENDTINDSFQTIDYSEYIAIGMDENDFLALDPIFVLVNHSYFLRITPTKHTLLDDNFSPCLDNPTNISSLMCKVFCQQDVRDSECDLPAALGYFRDSHLAGPHWNRTKLPALTTEDVTLAYFKDVSDCNKKIENKLRKCETELCPPLCEEMTYTTTIQTVTSRRIFKDLPEAALAIIINYQVRAGVVDVAERYAYTWYSFLSDVGGLIGLWCGASVVTIIPILTFCIHCTIRAYCSRWFGRGKDDDAGEAF